MENSGFQDGIDIDAMLFTYNLNQKSYMECRNDSHYSFIDGKFSP